MPAIQTLEVRSSHREEMIDITDLVRGALRKSAVVSGVAYVYCPHTTAAITIQENTDANLRVDILTHLARLIPQPGFRHDEGNADAHIKSSLLGVSQAILIEASKLALGTWQAIWFCEFDGPRTRKVLVKILEG